MNKNLIQGGRGSFWTEEEIKSKMNLIHNCDCIDFMKNIPDNYFDLVLTDPP